QSKQHEWKLFFSSRRRHTRFSRDWSSDVCSSDLGTDTSGNGDGRVALAGGLKKMVTENLDAIDARSVNSIPLFRDEEGREVVVQIGRAPCRVREQICEMTGVLAV